PFCPTVIPHPFVMTWRTSCAPDSFFHFAHPRRSRRVRLCANPDRLPAPEPTSDALDETAAAALDDAVRGAVATALTGKQRQVVEMYFFDGLSQGEIGRQLGITQQVVHKRLFGAVRRGRLIGGAIGRLRTVLQPLAAAHGWAVQR